MDILLGVGTLVLVLVIIVAIFSKYAPYGKQGLEALSGAACATFLPQAFLSYAIGGVFDIKFLDIGDLAGSLSGIAVGILTCLNLGVAPVFAVIVGLVLVTLNYYQHSSQLMAFPFLIKWIERKLQKAWINCGDLICTSNCFRTCINHYTWCASNIKTNR